MFKLVVVTPRGEYFSKEVSSLTIKLTTGYRTILTGHTPLIGALAYAPMHIVENSITSYYAIHGGAINVTKDGVTLILNGIEHESEIDLERAKAAKKRAEERLGKNDENIDTKRAQLALYRAVSRISTIER